MNVIAVFSVPAHPCHMGRRLQLAVPEPPQCRGGRHPGEAQQQLSPSTHSQPSFPALRCSTSTCTAGALMPSGTALAWGCYQSGLIAGSKQAELGFLFSAEAFWSLKAWQGAFLKDIFQGLWSKEWCLTIKTDNMDPLRTREKNQLPAMLGSSWKYIWTQL